MILEMVWETPLMVNKNNNRFSFVILINILNLNLNCGLEFVVFLYQI